MRALDCVLSSVELKRCTGLRPTLSGVPGVYQGVALQELCHGVSSRSASEDSDHPWVSRMAGSWGRAPRMDGTEKVNFTHISQIVGTD